MAWMQLVIAGLFEVLWAVGLKFTQGFTRIVPSVLTLAAMGVSFWFLTQALRTLPVGTAYAVWTGIGAVGTAVVGMLFLGEPRTALRIFFIALIVVGIAGLKWAGSR
ncbi:quaternary ammonium compound efflux SMR transporter SugE [Geoalkalibacter sp.]|uniref:quaternary ammonium compound efflux SMR transporter SugE n=1 Tax=Geoalkalibacter sp. TaxID=3041440 RepID=UPI00272E06B1|nr:quaternary ammonium compound efflux SMR transporter SugE [Geoalkalibacter sp.]